MALRIGLLCNESSLFEEGGQWKVNGDPTEGALIAAARKGGLKPEEEKERYPQIAMLPFESDRGYMATLHRNGAGKVILVKGALEKVLDLCTSCAESQPLRTREILETADRFAGEGMRVLAMAYKEAPQDLRELNHREVEGDLTLAGIQGMMDPPRPEAIEAVRGCKEAGIRVVMITGDHPTTAQAIGRMIGIGDGNSAVLTGKEVEALNDDELFADVQRGFDLRPSLAPPQTADHPAAAKAWRGGCRHRRRGERRAGPQSRTHRGGHGQIGNGRGQRIGGYGDHRRQFRHDLPCRGGRPDHFRQYPQGDFLPDSHRRRRHRLHPSFDLSRPAHPVYPFPALWINLVTNGFQVIALTFEPGEKGVMHRPPRDPREGIMSRLLIERTVMVGLRFPSG